MLKFRIFENGQPASAFALRNAHLLGADGNAIRSEIRLENGHIVCEKRESGSAALALQYPAGDLGELTLQTCLLPERDEPYILTLELARHRLMLLFNKREDWAMFDLEADHPVTRRAERAREQFIAALCRQGEDPAAAAAAAQECLVAAIDGTEELALAHSQLLMNKRKSSGLLPRAPFGCGVWPLQQDEQLRQTVAQHFDYLTLPTPWRMLSPEEGSYRWQALDAWVQWASNQRLPIVAGPLVSFEPANLPDWLYIWEHDYDTVRDLVYEHVEEVVSRYRGQVTAWNVVSGLHVNKHFTFNFEQIMDLTRMTTMLVKKLHEGGKTLIEIRQPFGEYYGANQRSIPPMMYADLVVQSGVQFDGYSLRYPMGQALPGQHTRDLMQVSDLLDRMQPLGKPVFLTLAAPSEPVTEVMIAPPEPGTPVDDNSGYWRRPWSTSVQGHWLEAAFQIAISKPYVEGVSWQELCDHPQIELPLSGLVSEDLQPKDALKRLVSFRTHLLAGAPPPSEDRPAMDTDAADSGMFTHDVRDPG